MLKGYIETLRAETDQQVKRPCPTTSVLSVKPLILQMEELFQSLPPSLSDRPWAIEDLVNRLQGRYREKPHAANVGQALRALGWVRVRDWTSAGGGRRYWKRYTPM